MPILVISEDPEHAVQVPRVENQDPIEAFSTHGSNKTFRDPIRRWHAEYSNAGP
jgi:hypothetical protein